MSVMFFGQYLLEHRKITVGQLREGLALVEKTRISFCELAEDSGALTELDAKAIASEATMSGRSARNLVVDYGLLSEENANAIEQELQRRQLRLGEALVKLGYLNGGELPGLLDAFHCGQAASLLEPIRLPEALEANRLAEDTLAELPHLLEALTD